MSDIGRNLDKHADSIQQIISSSDGIILALRRRSRLAMTLAEREEISRGITANWSNRPIAALIRRPPITVCLELARHGGRSQYRSTTVANAEAWEQAYR